MKIKALIIAGLLSLAFGGAALAAGLYTNGLPPAGGTQYPSTLPLTGNETAPFDTNLTQGQNPASEAITVSQLAQPTMNVAVNTTSFTATVGQMGGNGEVILDLTGTLGAGANVTTPTAAQFFAAKPVVGSTWVLRVLNLSAGAFSWTIVAGTGVTFTGAVVVAQNTWVDYVVTETSATTVTMVRIASGAA